MKLALALLTACQLGAAQGTTSVRGHAVPLIPIPAEGTRSSAAILFLPGDGGWRGTAITMARSVAAWGYDVFGFDTKKYLESFTDNNEKLTTEGLALDVRTIAQQISGASQRPVIVIGWSQGASMAVAAISGLRARTPIHGVITLGLPESGVLGWDWKATLAVVARREPDQPTFTVKPLLPASAPIPLWLIHGTEDEYTRLDTARALFRSAAEPKHLDEISGANHRFDGHRDELYQSLRKGLQWIAAH